MKYLRYQRSFSPTLDDPPFLCFYVFPVDAVLLLPINPLYLPHLIYPLIPDAISDDSTINYDLSKVYNVESVILLVLS